ncbi:MAG: hypothetical protein P1T08_03515 [Acidimicrobiia bacterium]|nr:hypothetical protein [Acidimicrobiia bacterium]
MLTRIRGALILTRLLSPLLLALALLLITSLAVRDIREASDAYGEAMAARVDAIQIDLSAASQGLETISTFVGKSRDAVAAQAEALRSLTDRIEISLPEIPVINFDLPDLDFKAPGVTQLKALGADLAEAGRAVGEELAAVAALGEVPQEIRAVAADTKTYGAGIWDTTFRWVRAVLIMIVLALIVLVLGRLAVFLQEFQTGWRMLRYGDDSGAAISISKLEARVRTLERALAGG